MRRLKVPPHVALVAVLKVAVEAEEHADIPDALDDNPIVLFLDADAFQFPALFFALLNAKVRLFERDRIVVRVHSDVRVRSLEVYLDHFSAKT